MEHGQVQINLVNHIKGLIEKYSSKTILKEYLQNSDDAGATELIVTYDKQTHQSLIGTDFEPLSGSALILSNNSSFREDDENNDFNNILTIQDEGKRKSAKSTGMFGLGFRSSYSITDYPTFISSNKVYWLDDMQESICKGTLSTYALWKESEFNVISDWLKTFRVAGDNKTIFRLPLRTKKSSQNSRISPKIFLFEDFLEWCKEWERNAKDLLFLRNINKLILQEITETGQKIIHLEIKTKNVNEIEKIKNDINNNFEDKTIETCNKWLTSNNPLPLHEYIHLLSISSFDKKTQTLINSEEEWMVFNGLFRGEDNSFIQQALEANERSNVLPWGAVAFQLKNNKPIAQKKGKWYNFLPLFESNHPILLHGWFDLHNDRTKLTYNDDKEVLKEWNQLVFEKILALLWIRLIEKIKRVDYLDEYYDFWFKKSNDKNIDSDLENYLFKGFYNKILKLDCLYIIYKNRQKWTVPTDNIFIFEEQNENKILLDAFQEHFQIITPNPPKYIIQNLKKIGVNIQKITPKFIREHLKELSKDIKFPVSINHISISMLKRKEYFIEVLYYCAETNYNLLENLPFELTSDNKISVVGEKKVLASNTYNMDLLQNNISLILDKDLVETVEKNSFPNSWLELNLKNLIEIIFENVNSFKLSKKWVTNIFDFIDKQSHSDIKNATELLWQFPIVYTNDKQWVNLKNDIDNKSPVFVTNKHDIKYLKKIGMNIINLDYLDIYKPILKYKKFITELTSETVIKHILLLNDFSFFEEKETRDFLIDLLANNSYWYNKLTHKEKEKLFSIKFIPTDSEELCSLNEKDELFLPTNFNAPHIKNLGKKYTLIQDIFDNKIYAMYKVFGIKEQNLQNYIKQIIIPFIENNSFPKDTILAFEWLLQQWNDNKESIDINLLKRSKIVPTESGDVKKIKDVYNPFIYIPEILSNIYTPYKVSDKLTRIWENFLNDLGSSDKIFPKHIFSKVLEIEKSKNRDDAKKLLNFIIKDIEERRNNNFINAKVDNEFLLKRISKHDWFPVEETHDYLITPSKEFKSLMKSSELVLYRDLKLIGSVRYTLDKDIKISQETAKKLGFITNIQEHEIFKNFENIKNYLSTKENEENQILNYSIAFYQYLGRSSIHNIPNNIKNKSILIHGKWFSSNRVFQKGVKLRKVTSWKTLISNQINNKDKKALQEGLIKLGVKKEPNIHLYMELLNELPQNTDLNNEDFNEAKILVAQINKKEYREEIRELTTLPLLTKKNTLIDFNNLYINDLPSYDKAQTKNINIDFCHSNYEDLAKKLKMKSLKDDSSSKINFDKTIKLDNINHPIIQFLNSEIFYNAILRIFGNEKKEIKGDILPKKIIFVKKLVIDYQVDNIYLFQDEFSTAYEENNILYLLEQKDTDDINESIAQYIADNQKLTSESLLLIIRVLRLKDEREINSFLDNKHVKSLEKSNTNILENDDVLIEEEIEVDEEKQKKLNNYFHSKFEIFRQNLYKWCKNYSKERDFLELLYKYEQHGIICYQEEKYAQVDEIFFKFIDNNFNFKIDEQIKSIDIDKQFEKNKNSIDISKIENNSEYRSLLYFDNKLEEVKEYIENLKNESNTINTLSDKTDIKNLGIVNIQTASEKRHKRNSTKPSKHSSEQDKNKKKAGETAEDKVIKYLKKHFTNVVKASEIADSYGYDIRYEDNNGNFKYVEIKKDSNNRFFITKNELEFARKHKTSFEIFVVKEDTLYKVPRKDFDKLEISPIKYEVKYSLRSIINEDEL